MAKKELNPAMRAAREQKKKDKAADDEAAEELSSLALIDQQGAA